MKKTALLTRTAKYLSCTLLVLCLLLGTAGAASHIFADMNTTDPQALTLDSVAWENLTYAEIFIDNNLAYVDGFDCNHWEPYAQHAMLLRVMPV